MGVLAAFKSIWGIELGIGSLGELGTKISGTYRRITSPAVHVTGVIGAESSDARSITITVKDRKGNAINYAAQVEVINFSSSAMTDFTATGGTTGIAQGGAGKLLAVVAKKLFRGITSTAGLITFTYTDTGTDASYLGVRLPNGEVVGIGSMTNA